MPNIRYPWEFHPQLSEERLSIIAKELTQCA